MLFSIYPDEIGGEKFPLIYIFAKIKYNKEKHGG